jgi:hypothetical protein
VKVLRSIRDSITAEPEAPARVLEPNDAAPDAPTREQQRSRRRHVVRCRSVSMKRLPKRDLEIGRALYPETDYWKPSTRAECVDEPRPCPFVSCRYHLYLDVSPQTGAIKLNFPDLEVEELGVSCVLDVAEHRGKQLEIVAAFLNMTRERVRQIEVRAFEKLAAAAPELRDLIDHETTSGRVHLRLLKHGDAVASAAGAARELDDHDATSPAVGLAGEDVRSALAAADWEEP